MAPYACYLCSQSHLRGYHSAVAADTTEFSPMVPRDTDQTPADEAARDISPVHASTPQNHMDCFTELQPFRELTGELLRAEQDRRLEKSRLMMDLQMGFDRL